MSVFKSFKTHSQDNWGTENAPSNEQLQIGALQRIADASEAMAKNVVQMQRDLDWYKKRYKEHQVEIEGLHKKISSLKGVNTKLKKQILKSHNTG